MHKTKRVTRRSERRLGVVLAALCASSAPLRAAAQEPGAEVIDAALVRADARFVAGDLAGALLVLEPVCSRSARPECAFSLGAIHHGLGHCSEALAHYRRYRALAPEGEHESEVAAALEEVESRCGAAATRAPSAIPPLAVAPMATEPPAEAAPAPRSASQPAPVAASDAAAGSPLPVALDPHTAEAARSSPSGPSGLARPLMTGAFVASGAAAATSAVFGVLAARSAARCDGARSYDRAFIEECEERGPRYQGLWQGFAIASGAFLGIGVTVWALDADSSASVGVSSAGAPLLQYRRRF